jgi:hypothetical protein
MSILVLIHSFYTLFIYCDNDGEDNPDELEGNDEVYYEELELYEGIEGVYYNI